MKGITPVIAVILLLLVTVAIVGFAFGFFQRIFGLAGTGVENQTTATIQRTALAVSIDNLDAANRKVTVRNSGTADIVPGRDIALFVAGTNATCSWDAATILPRTTSTCTWNNPLVTDCAVGSGKTVRAVAPGNEDSRKC